jgi:hypothetical protein
LNRRISKLKIGRNKLPSLVKAEIPRRISGTEGITCKDLADKLGKSSSHISQVLLKLSSQKRIDFRKEKINTRKAVRVYFRPLEGDSSSEDTTTEQESNICNQCQRFSGICRCILLDLVAEEIGIWSLPEDLQERQQASRLAKNTPACPYFDKRVNGHIRSKTVNVFIQRNTDRGTFTFHCPIKRCQGIIKEFSSPLRPFLLGSTTFYCPHCGSPMVFGYNHYLERYEVKYWDSRFDILQRDFYSITECDLPNLPKPKKFGVSIAKDNSFFLDLRNEVLFVGKNVSPQELQLSKDLTYFPLRWLDYIATVSEKDYHYLAEKLHVQLEGRRKKRKLYETIKLFPPREKIVSPTPKEKEVGGNEMIIATQALFPECFRANIRSRKALLEKKIEEEESGDQAFAKALLRYKQITHHYNFLQEINTGEWQKYEGGCGSIMFRPFKKEAKKYGFKAPSRVQSRMVRGEPFLPFGLYYARDPWNSLLNGVNHVVISTLKKETYNEIPLAWDGLRGWCHQGYPKGLLYDQSEQAKIISLYCCHKAIRQELITPEEFEVKRGKRYEPFFCLKPESEGYNTIKEIGKEALEMKVVLANGKTMKIQKAYEKMLGKLKSMLNTLANHSVYELGLDHSQKPALTLWKKLQQIKNKKYLTSKEQEQLDVFIERFFEEEFVFEPLEIIEIID